MSFPFEIYVIQATHGVVYGMLLFLVASGLTLVFGMMGVLNLAHASFYMLGAYFAYSVTLYSGNFWLSLLISPAYRRNDRHSRRTFSSSQDLQNRPYSRTAPYVWSLLRLWRIGSYCLGNHSALNPSSYAFCWRCPIHG